MVFKWFFGSNNIPSNQEQNNFNDYDSSNVDSSSKYSLLTTTEQINRKDNISKLTADEYYWKLGHAFNFSCAHTHSLISLFDQLKDTDYVQLKRLDSRFLSSLHVGCLAWHMDERARNCLPSADRVHQFLEVSEVLSDRKLNQDHSYENEGREIHQQMEECLLNNQEVSQVFREMQAQHDRYMKENTIVPQYLRQVLNLVQENNAILVQQDSDELSNIRNKNIDCSQSFCSEEAELYSKCQQQLSEIFNASPSSRNRRDEDIYRLLQHRCYVESQQLVMCNYSALCARALESCISRMKAAYQGTYSRPQDSELFQECFDHDQQFKKCTQRVKDSMRSNH
eukprot:gb/GECH01013900.1/.p1 GENE.gb/GECH01013900.1/~~gb/GECH01013900.1/.p1  ORF type:complete len:339 (+),score=67.39 gb/GECH01013900.1/:1-1017(+)